MKKKILSLFLCIFCILIVCSGCSKKPSKTSELTGIYQIIDKKKEKVITPPHILRAEIYLYL